MRKLCGMRSRWSWALMSLCLSGCVSFHNPWDTDSRGSTNAATLSISGSGTYLYGTHALSSNTPHSFTVTNNSNGIATLGTITTAGLGLAAPYVLSGGTCATGATLAAGASCTLTIDYSPSAIGSYSDTITLSYNDGVADQAVSRALNGLTPGPSVAVTVPLLDGEMAAASTYTAFPIAGSCTTSSGQVSISTPGGVATATANCTAGAWSTTINLSAIAEGAVVLTASQTENSLSGSTTRSVTKNTVYCLDPSHDDADLVGNGTGTVGDPYIICNLAQLNDVGTRLIWNTNEYFELGNSIDVAGAFTPISGLGGGGNSEDHFDGKHFIISNAIFNNAGGNSGLFENIGGIGTPSVSNIVFQDCQITTSSGRAGLLTGDVDSGATVSNITVERGTVNLPGAAAGAFVGGVLGSVGGGVTVTNVHSTATVIAPGSDEAGGLFGRIASTASVSDVSSAADHQVRGGLVGNLQGPLSDCSYSGAITGVTVSGVGGIAGTVADAGGDITDCSSTGSITFTGSNGVGGLVGSSTAQASITTSSSSMMISAATSDGIGGLVGESQLDITESFATGSVTGQDDVGGLIGTINNGSTVVRSYATGNVSGRTSVGGFLGTTTTNAPSITDAYAWGNVVATGNYAGGFLGTSDPTITNAYSLGTVTGATSENAGFVTGNTATVNNGYWNVFTSGINAVGLGVGLGTLVDDTAGQTQSSYVGFDFTAGTGDWKIDTSVSPYPILMWQ